MMKDICKDLESIGISCVYFINNNDCKIEFYYKNKLLSFVECCGKTALTHSMVNILKGLETNYFWLGLYYRLPLMMKAVDEQVKRELKTVA